MIADATTTALIPTVVGVLVAGVMGAIAWFFRSWANGLSDKVDKLSDKVDKLDDKIDTAVNELAQVKVVVGWPVQLPAQQH